VVKKKSASLQQASHSDQWLMDLDLPVVSGWTTDLISQLVNVWGVVRTLHLTESKEDKTNWKLTSYGEYTAALAYNAQLLDTTTSNFNPIVIQKRVWTSDRLATRGWPNNSICPLC
jgi:hypothetical protein